MGESHETVDDRLLQQLLRDIRQELGEQSHALLRTTDSLERLATRLGALEVRMNDLVEDIRHVVSSEGLRTRISLESKIESGLALIRAELRRTP